MNETEKLCTNCALHSFIPRYILVIVVLYDIPDLRQTMHKLYEWQQESKLYRSGFVKYIYTYNIDWKKEMKTHKNQTTE